MSILQDQGKIIEDTSERAKVMVDICARYRIVEVAEVYTNTRSFIIERRCRFMGFGPKVWKILYGNWDDGKFSLPCFSYPHTFNTYEAAQNVVETFIKKDLAKSTMRTIHQVDVSWMSRRLMD